MNLQTPNFDGRLFCDRLYSCPARCLLSGAWRFAVVSIMGFGVWAFAGRWFRTHGGEAALYGASTVVFVGLAGLLMHPLVRGPRRLLRFYGVFIPAFIAYAVVWCSFWFLLRFGAGEWLGSLAGSFALVAVTGWRFGNLRPVLAVSVAFFAAHSLGYFAGGKLMYFLSGPRGAELFNSLNKVELGMVAKLSWGLLYGLGFGAGLGYALHVFQKSDLIRIAVIE